MTTIRRAESQDCEAIYLLAKAFATSFSVQAQPFKTSFSHLLGSPDAFVAVAQKERKAVGYLLGFNHHTFYANGQVAWVEEIMVDEEFRRKGVGRKLMQSFEAWATQRGSKLVGLATRRAAPFYSNLGYEESATFFRKLL